LISDRLGHPYWLNTARFSPRNLTEL
jgi:hypothetical protein